MAKKNKQQGEFNPEESQKRIEKYYKSVETEKRGKRAVVSLIGGSILILLLLLAIILKLNGVGKTVMFTTDESGKVDAAVVDTEDVDGTNVLDYIVDGVENLGDTEETTNAN